MDFKDSELFKEFVKLKISMERNVGRAELFKHVFMCSIFLFVFLVIVSIRQEDNFLILFNSIWLGVQSYMYCDARWKIKHTEMLSDIMDKDIICMEKAWNDMSEEEKRRINSDKRR